MGLRLCEMNQLKGELNPTGSLTSGKRYLNSKKKVYTSCFKKYFVIAIGL